MISFSELVKKINKRLLGFNRHRWLRYLLAEDDLIALISQTQLISSLNSLKFLWRQLI